MTSKDLVFFLLHQDMTCSFSGNGIEEKDHLFILKLLDGDVDCDQIMNDMRLGKVQLILGKEHPCRTIDCVRKRVLRNLITAKSKVIIAVHGEKLKQSYAEEYGAARVLQYGHDGTEHNALKAFQTNPRITELENLWKTLGGDLWQMERRCRGGDRRAYEAVLICLTANEGWSSESKNHLQKVLARVGDKLSEGTPWSDWIERGQIEQLLATTRHYLRAIDDQSENQKHLERINHDIVYHDWEKFVEVNSGRPIELRAHWESTRQLILRGMNCLIPVVNQLGGRQEYAWLATEMHRKCSDVNRALFHEAAAIQQVNEALAKIDMVFDTQFTSNQELVIELRRRTTDLRHLLSELENVFELN